MKIYFRELYDNNGFNEFQGQILDINKTILRIECENNIKEVIIGDESFGCKDSNYIELIKFRTAYSSNIEIKVTEEQKDGKDKKYRKIIKVQDDSYVYDSMKLDSIRKLGEYSYENILNNFSNSDDDFLQTIMINLSNGLENIDEIYKAITKIIKLARDIAKNPKVELIQTEEVRESSEVKKISASSARYFTMHPEDWYREGESLPKPIKILTEAFEENKDIYENQIIRYVLYKARKIVNAALVMCKATESTLKTAIVKGNHEKVEEYKLDLEAMKTNICRLNSLKNELIIIKPLFNDITLNKQMKIRMTQKILYDKRYLRVVQLYKKCLKDVDAPIQEVFENTYSIFFSYVYIMAEVISKALVDLGFYSIEVDYEEEGKIVINSGHYVDEENFIFQLIVNDSFEANSYIKLTIKYYDKEYDISFFLNPLIKDKKISEEEINNIYDKFYDLNKSNTNLIINTLSLEEFKYPNDEVRDKLLFKLSNLGNNFISEKDYEKYGGFKVGMIPLGLNDVSTFYDKIIDLIYYKFIEMGIYGHCKTCRSGELRFIEEELLQCNNCGQKIAINICDHCGEKIIKVLPKEVEYSFGLDEESEEKNNIEKHKSYELNRTILGACYGNYKAKSGGFCNKCGKCSKKIGNCLRCSLADWEEK